MVAPSWTLQLKPASFRGVPFFTDDVSSEIGRRTVTHEFPAREDPFTEDLGRRARVFSISAYIADSHSRQPETGLNGVFFHRDKLVKAIERKGPGVLVHPYWGTFNVTIRGPVRVVESTDRGGMVTFQITFIEFGINKPPVSLPDSSGDAKLNAALSLQALQAVFAKAVQVQQITGSLRQSVLDKALDAALVMADMKQQISSKMNLIDSIAHAIDSFENNLSDLLNTPAQLAASFVGLMASVLNLIKTASEALDLEGFRINDDDDLENDNMKKVANEPTRYGDILIAALETAFAFPESAIDEVSPQRERQKSSEDAIRQLLLVSALASAVDVVSDLEFESANEALKMRDRMANHFDTLADDADDDLFATLEDTRTSMIRHLSDTAQTLPVVTDHTPKDVLPAVVIAYKLYGDAGREDEIVQRNRIEDPNLVPAEAIEVLSA